jgi:hypothetical protein
VKVERERTTGNKKRYKKEEERKKNAVRKKSRKTEGHRETIISTVLMPFHCWFAGSYVADAIGRWTPFYKRLIVFHFSLEK